MKKFKRSLLLSLALLVLNLGSSLSASAAQVTEINLPVTPLPAGDLENSDDTLVQTVSVPDDDWTSTGTQTLFAQYDVSDINTNLKCVDSGLSPMITQISYGGTVKAANPNIPNDDDYAFFERTPKNGIYQPAPSQGGGGSDSDLDSYLKGPLLLNPVSLLDFNTGGLKAYTVHKRGTQTNYSVTTTKPQIVVTLSCAVEDGVGVIGKIDKEKAPKTGPEEVVAFVTGAALVFVIYEVTKTIKKNKAAKKSSSK